MSPAADMNSNQSDRFLSNRRAAAQAYSEIAQLEGLAVPERIRQLLANSTPSLRQRPAEAEYSGPRKLSAADLLGRRVVATDLAAVHDQLSGRRVLVTGAGGAIGGELCRQIAAFGPEVIYMLDRSETNLRTVQRSMQLHPDHENLILADIKDREFLFAIFQERRPDVVIHAAGLEHRALLEEFPNEAWQTNVQGTWNVLSAALEAGCRRFVNVSSTEANYPAGIYGHMARVTERLTAWAALQVDGSYSSVRFGTVIDASGLLEDLVAQIELGGPVRVSHPDTTRYLISAVDACQLVLQAVAIGARGEVLVIDMGHPVRVLDLTKRAMTLLGKEVEVMYTGLRRGDVPDNTFLGAEHMRTTGHPLILRTTVPALDPDDLSFDALRASLRAQADGLARSSVPTERT